MIRNYEKREEEAELIFSGLSENPTTKPDSNNTSLRQLFLTQEKLLKQELTCWWEIKSLDKYLQIGRIPRGLRVCIFPPFEDDDIEEIKDWEQLLTTTSNEMIHRLIKYAKVKHIRLIQEITKVKENIEKLNIPEKTFKNYEILDEIIDKYASDIKIKKQRQFLRDELDYKFKRVYTFNKRPTTTSRGRSAYIKLQKTATTPLSSDTDTVSDSELEERSVPPSILPTASQMTIPNRNKESQYNSFGSSSSFLEEFQQQKYMRNYSAPGKRNPIMTLLPKPNVAREEESNANIEEKTRVQTRSQTPLPQRKT
ncbi:uncharacterized protein [Ambystoma mexicanum]|uniref:uncharacterized protein n=1 Tax=Ambystoma mexicanum TaxID=8296 RepID=UPI0037E8DEBF